MLNEKPVEVIATGANCKRFAIRKFGRLTGAKCLGFMGVESCNTLLHHYPESVNIFDCVFSHTTLSKRRRPLGKDSTLRKRRDQRTPADCFFVYRVHLYLNNPTLPHSAQRVNNYFHLFCGVSELAFFSTCLIRRNTTLDGSPILPLCFGRRTSRRRLSSAEADSRTRNMGRAF